jgi:phage tail-like protein
MSVLRAPLSVFRFHVDFFTDSVDSSGDITQVALCQGAFSECSGLEATMEPKVIKEGGLNYGSHQRPGPVNFGTVILKRGYSSKSGLWKWFQSMTSFTPAAEDHPRTPPKKTKGSSPSYGARLRVVINVFNLNGTASLAWQLDRALPVKFKAADLNAKSAEVGIEELHLAHEGLSVVDPTRESLTS